MSDVPLPGFDGVFGFALPAARTAVTQAPLGCLPGFAPVAALVPAFNQVMACFTALFALLVLRFLPGVNIPPSLVGRSSIPRRSINACCNLSGRGLTIGVDGPSLS